MTTRIRVIDFETTGLPPEADVVEAAYIDVVIGGQNTFHLDRSWRSFIYTSKSIKVEARAAHHIRDSDLIDGPLWKVVEPGLMHADMLYAAHHIDFEKAFFNPNDSRWVCTYKCALRLWPNAPSHSNQVLRYFLNDCDPGNDGMPPHRALPDCRVTALILIQCLQVVNLDIVKLVQWSSEPALLPRVPMGKHREKLWSEVPTDYLEWVLRSEFDSAVMHTARVELKNRRDVMSRG
jgi:exodeoxyribonuclease X